MEFTLKKNYAICFGRSFIVLHFEDFEQKYFGSEILKRFNRNVRFSNFIKNDIE